MQSSTLSPVVGPPFSSTFDMNLGSKFNPKFLQLCRANCSTTKAAPRRPSSNCVGFRLVSKKDDGMRTPCFRQFLVASEVTRSEKMTDFRSSFYYGKISEEDPTRKTDTKRTDMETRVSRHQLNRLPSPTATSGRLTLRITSTCSACPDYNAAQRYDSRAQCNFLGEPSRH